MNSKLLNAEHDGLEHALKEERAAKAIQEM
jgi:hypothetical protein